MPPSLPEAPVPTTRLVAPVVVVVVPAVAPVVVLIVPVVAPVVSYGRGGESRYHHHHYSDYR